MDSLAQTLAPARTVTIGGEAYKVTPITLNDLASFAQHLKDEARRSIVDSNTFSRAEKMTMVTDLALRGVDANEQMTTLAGVRYMFWQSLQKHQPGLTLDRVGDMVTTTNVEAISNVNQDADSAPDPEGQTESKKTEKQ